jgi:hypothetical protein
LDGKSTLFKNLSIYRLLVHYKYVLQQQSHDIRILLQEMTKSLRIFMKVADTSAEKNETLRHFLKQNAYVMALLLQYVLVMHQQTVDR